MKESISQEALVHVGVWCLGEFGDHLINGRAVGLDNQPIRVSGADVLDLLSDIMRKPRHTEKSSVLLLVTGALIKLTTRCPTEFDRIHKMLRRFECSVNLDLQQRACEFLEIMEKEWGGDRAGILDRMPVAEAASHDDRAVGDVSIGEVPPSSQVSRPNMQTASPQTDLVDLDDLLDGPVVPRQQVQPAAPVESAVDLLNLLGTGPAQPAPLPSASGSNLLDDMFGGQSPMPTVSTPPQPKVHEFLAFDTGGLRINFACTADTSSGRTVTAKFMNTHQFPMMNFVFEAAVPKYVQLSMQPATSSVLLPGSHDVTQVMKITNSTNGEKPVLMKLRICYNLNGSVMQEMAQVGQFPPGF